MSYRLEWLDGILGTWGLEKLAAILVVVVGGAYIGKEASNRRKKMLMLRDEALDRRQNAADMKIALAEKLHTDDPAILAKRRGIIAMSTSELSSALKAGELSAVEVLHAYQAKALDCTSQVNCVTEPIMEAEEWAEELDRTPSKNGLMYGIPVSVKESVNITGYDTNFGISKYIDKLADEDHVIVQVLKNQGAIPFMRTNLPQTMLSYSCSNPIYGETYNPYDCERCPGGSSGGEGALIGMHGSLIGIGSDIAGSVRIPAHFCGICSLKPTKGRLSDKGEPSVISGQKGLAGVNGVMSRDVDGIVLAMRALLVPEMFQLDCTVAPIPFNEKVFSNEHCLNIGYYEDDGFFTPVPACQRAVTMTVEALKKAGHKLIPFQVPSFSETENDTAGGHVFTLLHADGNKLWFGHLEGEQVDKHIATQIAHTTVVSLKHWLKWPFMSERMKTGYHSAAGGDRKTSKLFSDYSKRNEYVSKFISAWKEAQIDVLLCPAFGITACTNDYAAKLFFLAGTTGMYNLIDFPAGTVSVTKVTREDEENLEHSFEVKDQWDQMAKEACKDSLGLPVSVQCVALPWQEEMCLKLMKEVEKSIKL
ncbi:vitamin D3 hydroxylase-associated protein-like [Ptychodera flava]|uniref:vitamin D3 hydroxylase-associated protein-like n=1 Tax=Ptychodera flava TaxID=63121 RepID=UPI003969C158